jgi:hypothetical protein
VRILLTYTRSWLGLDVELGYGVITERIVMPLLQDTTAEPN